MAAALTALGVATPAIEPVGAMQEARSQKIMQTGAQFEQERQAFEQIAINGLGVMGGKLDGQVDPVAFDQMLGMMGSNPLAAKLKGRPELLPAIVNGSVNVLKSVNDRETYELAKQKFGLELQQALNKTPDAPDIETIFDPETGREIKVQWNGKEWAPIGGVSASTGGQTINIGPNGENYGNPGEGLVWQRDKDGKIVLDERGAPVAIPFKGGKAYAAQEAADSKADAAQTNRETSANIVVEDVERAITKIKDDPFWTTGLMGGWLSSVGGTPAADVAALIDTVESNTAFDKLQAMREASPTGGALGAVTERELTLLAAAIGSLKQKQTADQLLENLARVKEVYLDIIHGPGNRPDVNSKANVPEGAEETKELDGKTYYRIGAEWFEA